MADRGDNSSGMEPSDVGSWTPRGGPDPVMASRQARIRSGTTVVRLYTLGNRGGGSIVAWAVLLIAFLLFGKDSLTWPDPPSQGELAIETVGAFGLSLASYVCLGRPLVDIDSGMAIVRNPLRVNRVPLGSVVRVDRTWAGRVRLHTAHDRVVLWGMEQPLKQRMIGYTEDVRVLLAEVAASGGVTELAEGPERSALARKYAAISAALVAADRSEGLPSVPAEAGSSWKPFDRGLIPLLLGWAIHLTMTIPAIASGA